MPPRRRWFRSLWPAALGVAALVGCGGGEPGGEGAPAASIRLATTTSTENSGLLAALLPVFEERTGIRVDVIAVGTGAALRLGAQGDVDVVLVHAPEAEKEFVDAGHGVDRTPLMYNDFVIVGPAEDPAGIRGVADASGALRGIAAAKARFYSRDDDSGTHKKENSLWKAVGIDPRETGEGWHFGTGQGMGATLTIADEAGGYTLTDRGTFLAFRDRIDLVILVEGDPALRNPYAAMAVNPARHPHVRYDEARRLIDWLASEEGQGLIDGFRLDGERLFHPGSGEGK
jgi:tungstate transport system substrate-binding protein